MKNILLFNEEQRRWTWAIENQIQLLTQTFTCKGERSYQEENRALRDPNAHLIIKAVSWPPPNESHFPRRKTPAPPGAGGRRQRRVE